MIKAICDNKKRIIYGIFVIAWMILIFSFSSQNGEESQKTSEIGRASCRERV